MKTNKNGVLRTSEPQNVYKAEVTYDTQGNRTGGAVTSENFTEIYNKVSNGESVKLIEYSDRDEWYRTWTSVSAGFYGAEGSSVTFVSGVYTTRQEDVGDPEYRTYVGGPGFENKSWYNLGSRLLSVVYPEGSIFITTVNQNPGELLKTMGLDSTWVSWGSGRVPVGVDENDEDFNSSEKTGGKKTHTLTIAEMPKHEHHIDTRSNNSGAGNRLIATGTTGSGSNQDTQSTGGSAAHNNLQPYITCYMWKRVK